MVPEEPTRLRKKHFDERSRKLLGSAGSEMASPGRADRSCSFGLPAFASEDFGLGTVRRGHHEDDAADGCAKIGTRYSCVAQGKCRSAVTLAAVASWLASRAVVVVVACGFAAFPDASFAAGLLLWRQRACVCGKGQIV